MVTIDLTDEEYFFLKGLMQRIVPKSERNRRVRKWIKHDGCMFNLETGSILDISSNKFVIDPEPNLRALADQMLTGQLPDCSNLKAPDRSAHNDAAAPRPEAGS